MEIVPIKTSGDRGERELLGAFVREIQEALLDERIDIALHCLKDLPTEGVSGLQLSAHLEREDPRDALICRGSGLESLPSGAVLGTGSVRRTSQMIARRSDLTFKPLVGNVDTRLRKLIAGEYQGIVLAMAGLKRLGLLESWAESEYAVLSVHPMAGDVMLPAPGQAVLVLETRDADHASIGLVAHLDHKETRAAATAERAFLKTFGGGCSVPVAAFARAGETTLVLEGLVASLDGRQVIRGVESNGVGHPESVGKRLAEKLGAQGAFEIVNDLVLAGGARA